MKTAPRMVVTGLAATVVALAAGAGAVPANADGPGTDRRIVAAIEAQPWKLLKKGDENYRVAAARCFLAQFKYFNGCNPKAAASDDFDDTMVAAVKKYQGDRGLQKTGELNDETWVTLRNDHGIARPGDTRVSLVKGLQHSLNILGDAISVDGVYGNGTKTAVWNFQKRKEIGTDGSVGPITFRAMFAQGAESRRTPR
ncbi:peptidoglycan-binding domain-containing protein [Actinomadura rubrisoli]|uniref:Peptidoglycan-binding protein n=1 Tax=Actinomadura rubrisoli TaxID=2530368 RepID=A0A4R5BIB3_9ACTN|nr:peptidoglycan-binding protein [Actinomadura rubrisoli]TDD84806.1 peptidoglycan-binding protein [Actinomadura rubrisoli]